MPDYTQILTFWMRSSLKRIDFRHIKAKTTAERLVAFREFLTQRWGESTTLNHIVFDLRRLKVFRFVKFNHANKLTAFKGRNYPWHIGCFRCCCIFQKQADSVLRVLIGFFKGVTLWKAPIKVYSNCWKANFFFCENYGKIFFISFTSSKNIIWPEWSFI